MKRLSWVVRTTGLLLTVLALIFGCTLSGVALNSMPAPIRTAVARYDKLKVVVVESALGWHVIASPDACVNLGDKVGYKVNIDKIWYDEAGVGHEASISEEVNLSGEWGGNVSITWSFKASWSTGETQELSGVIMRPEWCVVATVTVEIPTVTNTATLTALPTLTSTSMPSATSSPTVTASVIPTELTVTTPESTPVMGTATPTATLPATITPTLGITPILGTPVAETATPSVTPTLTPITPTVTVTPTIPVVTVTPTPETTPTPTQEVTPEPTPTHTEVVTNTVTLPGTGVDELGFRYNEEPIGYIKVTKNDGTFVFVDMIYDAGYNYNAKTGEYEVVVPAEGFVLDRGHLESHLFAKNRFLSLNPNLRIEIMINGVTKFYRMVSTYLISNEQAKVWEFVSNKTGIPDIVTCEWPLGSNAMTGHRFYTLEEDK